jgi:hypothetical protein
MKSNRADFWFEKIILSLAQWYMSSVPTLQGLTQKANLSPEVKGQLWPHSQNLSQKKKKNLPLIP